MTPSKLLGPEDLLKPEYQEYMLNLKATATNEYLEIRQQHLDFHLMAQPQIHSYRTLEKLLNIPKSQLGQGHCF